jgi:hypothetical protein
MAKRNQSLEETEKFVAWQRREGFSRIITFSFTPTKRKSELIFGTVGYLIFLLSFGVSSYIYFFIERNQDFLVPITMLGAASLIATLTARQYFADVRKYREESDTDEQEMKSPENQ